APTYRTANFDLGKTYALQGQRVPALLAYLRFLSLEARTPRVREAALAVRAIRMQGVKQEGKNITVAIPSDQVARKDALAKAEFALSMWGAIPVDASGPNTEINAFVRGLDLFVE